MSEEVRESQEQIQARLEQTRAFTEFHQAKTKFWQVAAATIAPLELLIAEIITQTRAKKR